MQVRFTEGKNAAEVLTMRYQPLGKTGIEVSKIAFGAGPVSGLFTGRDFDRQRAIVSTAVSAGVNWFDTAATYGNGQSETALGQALHEIRPDHPVHVATKVRVNVTTETDFRPMVVDSVRQSLERLQRKQVTLLQIHNSITWNRSDQPTSVTPDDVLGPRGLLAGMLDVREAGWVTHFGLTGIGDAEALRTVMRSGAFDTIQAPFHWLNPSALIPIPKPLADPDYGGFLQTAHELGMGIFAIRIYAAGALLDAEPSAHTLKTPFFPLDLYERDRARVQALSKAAGFTERLPEIALRYVLAQPQITSAITGFSSAAEVKQAVALSEMESMSPGECRWLSDLRDSAADLNSA